MDAGPPPPSPPRPPNTGRSRATSRATSTATSTARSGGGGGRSHSCRFDDCTAAFSSSSNRTRHERVAHGGIAPAAAASAAARAASAKGVWTCRYDGCETVFTASRNRARHERSVHGELFTAAVAATRQTMPAAARTACAMPEMVMARLSAADAAATRHYCPHASCDSSFSRRDDVLSHVRRKHKGVGLDQLPPPPSQRMLKRVRPTANANASAAPSAVDDKRVRRTSDKSSSDDSKPSDSSRDAFQMTSRYMMSSTSQSRSEESSETRGVVPSGFTVHIPPGSGSSTSVSGSGSFSTSSSESSSGTDSFFLHESVLRQRELLRFVKHPGSDRFIRDMQLLPNKTIGPGSAEVNALANHGVDPARLNNLLTVATAYNDRPHRHGVGCGHTAVVHSDHLDFITENGTVVCNGIGNPQVHRRDPGILRHGDHVHAVVKGVIEPWPAQGDAGSESSRTRSSSEDSDGVCRLDHVLLLPNSRDGAPVVAGADHVHDIGCGHAIVFHGDHLDFLGDDGILHRPIGETSIFVPHTW